MKSLSRVIFALWVSLFLMVPPAVGQTTGDPEIKQIMIAAKTYAKRYGGTEDKFEYRFRKRVGDYAHVWLVPKPRYKNQFEGASIILQKINGKWVGQFSGTYIDDWEKKVPELFK